MTEILADDVEVERRSHDHGAVAPEHGDDVLGTEMQATEQVVKIGKADRTRDHAEKASVLAGNPPAEYDRIGAMVQHRAADEEPGVGLVAMDLEVLFIAA